MESQDQRFSRIIKKRFRKSGASEQTTGLLEELPSTLFQDAVNKINFEQGEIPIAGAFLDSWFLVTTRRVFIAHDDDIHLIRFENLRNIGPVIENKKQHHFIKSNLCYLEFEDHKNRHFTIQTAPGSPCFGIWNILLLAQKMGPHEKPSKQDG